MSESDTPRWSAINQLVSIIRQDDRIGGAVVEPGWPGENEMRSETIWIGDEDGEVSIVTIREGRKVTDDQFTLPVNVRITGRTTLLATRQRLDELVAAVHDATVETASLDSLSDDDGAWFVVSAVPASKRATGGRTAQGCIGFAEYVVAVHIRIN